MEKQEVSVKEVLEIFIRYPIYDIDNAEVNNKIQKLIDNLGKSEKICKNYSVISKTIYSLNEIDFANLKIFFGIESEDHFSQFSNSSPLGSKGKDNLQHFWRHVVLSCYQRQYIENITKNVNENVRKTSERLENIGSNVDKVSDRIEKIGNEVDQASKDMGNVSKNFTDVTQKANQAENKVNGIYSEFVGILGVFTALSFALMGSVQVFGNILKNVHTPTLGNIGYVLVVGGIYLLLIYLVIMTLFIGMKKVFNTNENFKYKFDPKFTKHIRCTSFGLVVFGIVLVAIHEIFLT
ncbi:hypothetical protein [Ligilactobacillus salivarius]|uniref:Uncharacterized protein n=1 Tax=Ligilactobacillus salivarius TaxID=1624 RepID=A0A9X6S4Q0_9LACO|nr:hypothetical protein [Ligilactobacillus salivarius]PAY25327.1 hypothetical protein A8C33_02530 [Ligilactobacillus salivarius]PAY28756.1 hypothetical protein A8C44_02560 [Ligilactobacillus salivarius]PAY29633.1 hypothetical protein A8C49_00535 [Ligilactobacillus salivarius]PAY33812.1 hypothetical protein A8C50_09425 [Ligilactobacillus salivarius]PAY39379.1 hypothetical protein A8C51_09220 [Ligilactobacillus salivarius]